MATIASVIVLYIWLHVTFLLPIITLNLAVASLTETSLKEVILDIKVHKSIFKLIILIFVGILGISLLIVIIGKMILKGV
ncbi:hypothetical protein IGJ28_003502 [Enterococcus sp. AZ091]|uniref:hypothetical protein n=1 Tax=Enterococcus sp. AZ091 TaxID=2774720 RepID=UPI003F2613FC